MDVFFNDSQYLGYRAAMSLGSINNETTLMLSRTAESLPKNQFHVRIND
jgi:hypothetical protein